MVPRAALERPQLADAGYAAWVNAVAVEHLVSQHGAESPSVREWVRRVAMMGSHQLRFSEFWPYRVSTVLLGWNHSLEQGVEAWFETSAVDQDGANCWMERSADWEQALDLHANACEYFKTLTRWEDGACPYTALDEQLRTELESIESEPECADYRQLWRRAGKPRRICDSRLSLSGLKARLGAAGV